MSFVLLREEKSDGRLGEVGLDPREWSGDDDNGFEALSKSCDARLVSFEVFEVGVATLDDGVGELPVLPLALKTR